MVVIERLRKTGEQYVPHRYEDGRFRVADPTLGAAKKLKENQILVETQGELVSYTRRGFHVRMSGERNRQPNLISSEHIIIR